MSTLMRSFLTVVVGVVGTYVLVAGISSVGLSRLPERSVGGLGLLESFPHASTQEEAAEGGGVGGDAAERGTDGAASPKAAEPAGLRVRVQTPDALAPGRTRQIRLHVEDRPLRPRRTGLSAQGQMLAIDLSIEPGAGGGRSAWVNPHRLLVPRDELSWTRIHVGVVSGAACGTPAGELHVRVRDIADGGSTDETSTTLPTIVCRDLPPEAPESVHDTSIVCGGDLVLDPRVRYADHTTAISPCREPRAQRPRPAPRPPEPDDETEDEEDPDTVGDVVEDGADGDDESGDATGGDGDRDRDRDGAHDQQDDGPGDHDQEDGQDDDQIDGEDGSRDGDDGSSGSDDSSSTAASDGGDQHDDHDQHDDGDQHRDGDERRDGDGGDHHRTRRD